jgi:hypothetical protein
MWPWDHLAAGYVVFSLLLRSTGREPPSVVALGFLVLGSQLPDLIDKPLGWYVGLLPSGTSLAHSLVVAVPLCGLVVLWRVWRGAPAEGVGFALGYLLHPLADAYYPLALGLEAKPDILLWPLRSVPKQGTVDVTAHVLGLLGQFYAAATGPGGIWLIAIEVGFLGSAATLWYLDGMPGLPGSHGRRGPPRPESDG